MRNKKYIIIILHLIDNFFIHNDQLYAQVPMPAAYGSDTKINYIRIWDAWVPETDTNQLVKRPIAEVRQTTQYFDGLGRPLQIIVKQGSPLQKDMVTATVYDALGREQYQYLPFVSTMSDGKFKRNPFQQQAAFGVTEYPGETFYYQQNIYEASPLNRIIKTFAAGNSWAGSKGSINEKAVQQQYGGNSMGDSVHIWNISMTAGSLPINAGIYPAGTLYKNTIINEQGKQTVVYKDLDNRIILQKNQLAVSPGTAHIGWLCTYYVYDDLNNLRFVLQPKAVELVNSTWKLTQTIADELCFRNEYDERKRKIIEKMPGAGEVWLVYDARDRLVMRQDANLRVQGKWLVYVYDLFNRQQQSGILTSVNNRAYHAPLAGVSTTYPNTIGANYDLLTETYYDDYRWIAASGSNLSDKIDSSNTKNTTYFFTSYNTAPQYAQSITQAPLVIGQITGSKVKILDSSPSQYLYTATFYDEKYRTIQVQSTNTTTGKDIITTQYDFSGKPLQSLLQHQKKGINAQTYNVLTGYAYDAGGRLLILGKMVSGIVAGKTINAPVKIIAANVYNELGQLQKKMLGGGLESLIYDYNIRGWMTGINKKYIAGVEDHYFGMELGYDKMSSMATGTSYTNPQFGGNISGTVWKSAGDGVNRKYDYSYDAVNRLSMADFLQNSSGTTWDKTSMDYTTAMSYDANGNILTMNQQGFKLGVPTAAIDQLKYMYVNSGASNKLLQVTDAVNDSTTALGDFHYGGAKGAIDYIYDGNGNLTVDANKKIGISYNYLNLPSKINAVGKGKIIYTYDAGGNKLQKIVIDSTVKPVKVTSTLYINEVEYVNDTLQKIAHEEGRIRLTTAGFVYDYFIKDHLGNVRMMLTSEQQKDVYPAATLESAGKPNPAINDEKWYYTINTANVVDNSMATGISTYQNNNGFSYNHPDSVQSLNSQKVYKLNSSVSGAKAGLGITLKVMSGDRIDIFAKSFYTQTANSTYNNLAPLDIINSLLISPSSPAAVHGTAAAISSNPIATINPLATFLTRTPTAPQIPKAYVNYILFDEQFRFAGGGVSAVGTAGTVKDHYSDLQNIAVKKSGYIYIYVSNESPVNVFFDNMQVVHTRGPLLEETHYYPFGLTMAGISSRALNWRTPNNKCKYNGIESNTDFDFNIYDAFYRNLDPQIGRFWQVDPVITTSESPYVSMGDNPILNKDWLGNYFTWGNQTVEHTYKELREENSKRISSYMNELATLDLTSKDEKVQKKIEQLTGLINSHTELNSEWNEMEASNVEFCVTSQIPSSSNATGETSFNIGDKSINIRLGKDATNIATMAHELRHGYGFLNGEMLGTKGKDPLYDMMDEVNAYNAGFLFLDKKTASLQADGFFNLNWFKNNQLKNYSSLSGREQQLTLNTPATTFLQYNPVGRISSALKNNVNMTIREAIDFYNSYSQKTYKKPEFYTGPLLNNR